MQKSVLGACTLSAWAMVIVCDRIKQVSGFELTALLCAAIMLLIFGLYAELWAKNKHDSKEEL